MDIRLSAEELHGRTYSHPADHQLVHRHRFSPPHSQFIEEAVKWRLFHQTVGEAREAFAGVPADELDGMINEAIQTVRKEKRRARPDHTPK